MATRCKIVASLVVAVGMLVCSTVWASPKLAKNLAQINDYLEEKVDSDDLEANVAKAREWLRDKSAFSRLFDRSVKGALKIFTSMPETVKNVPTCGSLASRGLLERCERELANELYLDKWCDSNYRPRRIDRILEEVAYRNVRLCRLARDWPELKFTFKQLAYDHINGQLVERVDVDEPEANMREVERMLQSVDDQQGSYALALKQLLALKTTLAEESCNEQGLEKVLKNDLATRGKGHEPVTSDQTRINKLVRYYILNHSVICDPIYQKNLLAHLNKLDEATYRRVLAFASAYYLTEDQYGAQFEQVRHKQVNEDFKTPLIAEKDKTYIVSYPTGLYAGELTRYLKEATSQDVKKYWLAKFFPDEPIEPERVSEFAKLEVGKIYNEYIYEPCEKFYNLMRPDMEIFEYNWRVIRFTKDLSIRLLRSAFYSCRNELERKEGKWWTS